MVFFVFLIFIYLFIIIFLLKLINSAAQNHCLPRQKDAYDECVGHLQLHGLVIYTVGPTATSILATRQAVIVTGIRKL